MNKFNFLIIGFVVCGSSVYALEPADYIANLMQLRKEIITAPVHASFVAETTRTQPNAKVEIGSKVGNQVTYNSKQVVDYDSDTGTSKPIAMGGGFQSEDGTVYTFSRHWIDHYTYGNRYLTVQKIKGKVADTTFSWFTDKNESKILIEKSQNGVVTRGGESGRGSLPQPFLPPFWKVYSMPDSVDFSSPDVTFSKDDDTLKDQ